MAQDDASVDKQERIERAFALLSLLEEPSPSARRPVFGVREVMRFFKDLTHAQTAILFPDPVLRRVFNDQKKKQQSFCTVDVAAAASDGEVRERTFAKGRIVTYPSKRANQWYVTVTFEVDEQDLQRLPKALILQKGDAVAKLPLSAVIELRAVAILDATKTGDADILKLLQDPLATGEFIS